MQEKTVIDVNNIYTREWMVDPEIPMDEDCLYLNVWTPAKVPMKTACVCLVFRRRVSGRTYCGNGI